MMSSMSCHVMSCHVTLRPAFNYLPTYLGSLVVLSGCECDEERTDDDWTGFHAMNRSAGWRREGNDLYYDLGSGTWVGHWVVTVC